MMRAATKTPRETLADRKLDGLQYLRALAAILVVLEHAAIQVTNDFGVEPVGSLQRVGNRGVELFFVISGFIMMHVHARDPLSLASAKDFFLKRQIRILPLCFLVATGWALLLVALEHIEIDAPRTSLDVYLSSAFLYPMLDKPAPGQIWTLRNEMLFYLLFMTFFMGPRVFAATMLIWLVAIVLWGTPGNPAHFTADIPFETLVSNFNILFMVGIAAYLAIEKWGARSPPPGKADAVLFLAFTVGFVVAAFLFQGHLSNTGAWVLIFGALALGCVIFSVRLGQGPGFARGIAYLGDASYSIYLVHLPLLAMIMPFTKRLTTNPDLLYPLNAVLAVAGSLIAYVVVERPVHRWCRRRLAKSGSG